MATPMQVSNEELALIKSYLIYPLVLDMLERDIKILKENDKLKMPDIYAMKLKSVMNSVTTGGYEIRIELRKRGIKIYDEKRTETKLEAKYACRGYQHEFSMLWTLVKTEVQLMLCKYLEVDITDEKLR